MSGAAMPDWLWARYEALYTAGYHYEHEHLTAWADALHGEWFA